MEAYEQYIQLYESYPLKFFTKYRKITSYNKCILTDYDKMEVSLSSFVDIIIQLLLLMYQALKKQQTLALISNPCIQYGRKIHLYILNFKGQKRFAQINQLQISAEIIKFIRNLSKVKIINAQEHSKQRDFQSIVKWFERYLEQDQPQKISTKINQNGRNKFLLLDMLTKVRDQNEIVRYSRILQKLNYNICNKIMLSPELSYRHLKGGRGQQSYQGETEEEEWKRRVDNLHQFLLDLEKSQVINSFKKDGDTVNERYLTFDRVKFNFFVDIMNVDGYYENQIPELVKCCQKIKVELILDRQKSYKMSIRTNSLWILDRMHYFQMSQLWGKLKNQWIKLSNYQCITLQTMSLQKMSIIFDQDRYFQISQDLYLNDDSLKKQVTCMLDKQILFHLMMSRSLEASHMQANESNANESKANESIKYFDDTIFTLSKDNFDHTVQDLKQCMLFMSKKFEKLDKISKSSLLAWKND